MSCIIFETVVRLAFALKPWSVSSRKMKKQCLLIRERLSKVPTHCHPSTNDQVRCSICRPSPKQSVHCQQNRCHLCKMEKPFSLRPRPHSNQQRRTSRVHYRRPDLKQPKPSVTIKPRIQLHFCIDCKDAKLIFTLHRPTFYSEWAADYDATINRIENFQSTAAHGSAPCQWFLDKSDNPRTLRFSRNL